MPETRQHFFLFFPDFYFCPVWFAGFSWMRRSMASIFLFLSNHESTHLAPSYGAAGTNTPEWTCVFFPFYRAILDFADAKAVFSLVTMLLLFREARHRTSTSEWRTFGSPRRSLRLREVRIACPPVCGRPRVAFWKWSADSKRMRGRIALRSTSCEMPKNHSRLFRRVGGQNYYGPL
jgi:hypothetical protein